MNKEIKYLDKLPTGDDRVRTLPEWVVNGIVFPQRIIKRRFRKKVICSGSPMNQIDFRMRAKYNREIVRPVVKYYEVVRN